MYRNISNEHQMAYRVNKNVYEKKKKMFCSIAASFSAVNADADASFSIGMNIKHSNIHDLQGCSVRWAHGCQCIDHGFIPDIDVYKRDVLS